MERGFALYESKCFKIMFYLFCLFVYNRGLSPIITTSTRARPRPRPSSSVGAPPSPIPPRYSSSSINQYDDN